MNSKFITILFCLLSALFLLSACASPPARTGSFPTGTHVYKFDHEVQMTFNKDGTFELVDGEETITSGTYYIEDDVLIFGLDTYCLERGVGSFSYYWSLEDGVLTFEPIGEDDCLGRKNTMHVPWLVNP